MASNQTSMHVGGMDQEDWSQLLEQLEQTIPIYDLTNRLMTGGWDTYWRWAAYSQVQPGDSVVEIGSGPGSFALHLKCKRLVLVDPSPAMARVCERRLIREGSDAQWRGQVVAAAEAIPLATDSFDRAFCVFSFRDFFDKPRALAEIHRILKPGGELVICDLGKVNKMHGMMGEVFLSTVGMAIARLVAGPNHPFLGLFETYRAYGTSGDYVKMLRSVDFLDAGTRLLFPGGASLIWGRKPTD